MTEATEGYASVHFRDGAAEAVAVPLEATRPARSLAVHLLDRAAGATEGHAADHLLYAAVHLLGGVACVLWPEGTVTLVGMA